VGYRALRGCQNRQQGRRADGFFTRGWRCPRVSSGLVKLKLLEGGGFRSNTSDQWSVSLVGIVNGSEMPRRGFSLRLFRSMVVVGLMAVPVLAAAGTANASAELGNTPRVFAVQVRDAGLDLQQARVLQLQIDAYLARVGGTQVAANEIRYGGGASLILPLPGETRARSLAAGRVAEPTGCPFQYLCAYQYEGFAGGEIHAFYCGVLVSMPWGSVGSWRNNQTSGTVGTFYGGNPSSTGPAYSSSGSYNWLPVSHIRAC
jgi:hypothetical protein